MDIDLVIALLREGDIDTFLGVDADLLLDREAFDYTRKFVVDHGKFPKEETLCTDLSIKPLSVIEPSEYYLGKINKRHKMNLLKTAFVEAEDALKDKKPLEDAVSSIKKMLIRIEETGDDDGIIEISSDAPNRVAEYEERAKFGGTIGISSPWEELDDITSGWCEGNVVIVVGPTEIGKSWWLTKQFEHSADKGDRPLLVSIELIAKTIAARHDAIYTGVSYEDMRRGTLDGFEEKTFKDKMDILSKRDEKGWVVDASHVTKPADIEFLVHRLNPSLILLDGLYLLQSYMRGGTWEKVADVVRQLQLIANRTKLPIIATSQFKREIKKGAKKAGEKGDITDIGYSHAIAQAADICIALKQDDYALLRNEMLFDIIKGREISKKARGIKVKWEIPNDFTFISYEGTHVEDDEEEPIAVGGGVKDDDDFEEEGGIFSS